MLFGLIIIIALAGVGFLISFLAHPATLFCFLTLIIAVLSSAVFEGVRVYNLEGDDYLNEDFSL